jgi:hypothetical protein
MHSRLKPLLTVFLFSIICSSCLTPRRIDRWIDKEYGSTASNKQRTTDYLTVKYPQGSANILAHTEKRKMKMLPLLFYWKWEYGTVSDLNPNVPAWYFQSALLPYANAKGLRQKLNGAKLELNIEKLPTGFSVVDKGWLVYVLIYDIHWEKVFIDPTKQPMVVTYRVVKDGTELKKGTLTVADRNQVLNVRVFHSVKKTFWGYLDQYNTNMQSMSKELVDQLLKEL